MLSHARSPRPAACLLAACLLASLAGLRASPAGAEDEPPSPPRALQARVNEAIDAGVTWLRAQQREDGTFPLGPEPAVFAGSGLGDASEQWAGGPWDRGLDALCVYTLAVCGVERDDPALEKGFAALRRHWADRQPADPHGIGPRDGISTYFVALCLLALDAAYNRGAAPLAQGPPDKRRTGRKQLGKTDFAWAEELAAWLEAAQDPGKEGDAAQRPRRGRKRTPPAKHDPSPEDGGGFGYGSPAEPTSYHDHSNSQFAVLGLKAAARVGVDVSDAVFLRALRHFLAVQEHEGPQVERVDAADADDDKAERAPGETRTTDEATPKYDAARGWGYMCPGSMFTQTGPPDVLPPGAVPGLPGGATPVAPDVTRETTAPMTAGGVSTLVICRSELDGVRGFTPELRRLTVRGIRDGLAWLALRLAKAEKEAEEPPPGLPPGLPPGFPPGFPPGALPQGLETGGVLDDFYFLYGLERACILGGVGTVGGVAWYDVGARRIVDRQREDGSFLSKDMSNGNGRPSIDSCFALLFLKRAVFRVPDRRVVTPSD